MGKKRIENGEAEEEALEAPPSNEATVGVSDAKAISRQLKEAPSVKSLSKLVESLALVRGHLTGQKLFDDARVLSIILSTCTKHVPAAIAKLFKTDVLTAAVIRALSKNPAGSHRALFRVAKAYLTQFSFILGDVTDSQSEKRIVEHLLELAPMCAPFPRQSSFLAKKLLKLWCIGRPSCEVAGRLLVELARAHPNKLLDKLFKQMYAGYIKMSKSAGQETWTQLDLMKKSFSELCKVDPSLSFKHAFLYVRQIAVHVRSAILDSKHDKLQKVYNWPVLMCLYLWSDVLTTVHGEMNALVYPLCQVVIAAARVSPLPRHIPYKLHCARILTELSKAFDIHCPSCQLCVEALDAVDWKRRYKNSLKIYDLRFMLKFSQSQLMEFSFVESVVNEVESVILDSVGGHLESSALQDLLVAIHSQLKSIAKFNKSCRAAGRVLSLTKRLEREVAYRNQGLICSSWDIQMGSEKALHDVVEKSPLAKHNYIRLHAKDKAMEILRTAKEQQKAQHDGNELEPEQSRRKEKRKVDELSMVKSKRRRLDSDGMLEDDVLDLDLRDLELD